MKVEGEFWVWKLSDVEVLFKVDGVSVRLIGEVVNGVISHQVETPRLTPIITAIMEVDEVLFSSSFDGRSPRVATKGDLVIGVFCILKCLSTGRPTKKGVSPGITKT